MSQTTLSKFGYPQSLICSFQYWHILLRPGQPTLGSLILICTEDVDQYSKISNAAAAEQQQIILAIENVLKQRFCYSKMNYLMLMMVDPAVHFHVIPRYEFAPNFCSETFADKQWPNPPSLGDDLQLADNIRSELLKTLQTDFIAYQQK